MSCSRRALRGSSADGRVDSVREPCRPPLRLRKQEPRSGEPSPSVEVLICSGLWRLTRGWARIVQLRAGQHLGPGTVGRLAPAVGPGPRSYYFSSGLEGTVRRPSPFDSILFGFLLRSTSPRRRLGGRTAGRGPKASPSYSGGRVVSRAHGVRNELEGPMVLSRKHWLKGTHVNSWEGVRAIPLPPRLAASPRFHFRCNLLGWVTPGFLHSSGAQVRGRRGRSGPSLGCEHRLGCSPPSGGRLRPRRRPCQSRRSLLRSGRGPTPSSRPDDHLWLCGFASRSRTGLRLGSP